MALQRESRPTWQVAGLITLAFVALLWLLEIIDTAADHRLDGYGVEPRSAHGLLGILFAPVLHGGWGHLEANTVPTLVLGFLVLATGIVAGLEATAIIWVVGGVGVWLVAPADTIHLGASVLIFGWVVHLVVRGLFTRRLGQLALGVVVFLVYGGVLLGVLPGEPGISWQGHLFGALGGALAAWLIGWDEKADRRTVV